MKRNYNPEQLLLLSRIRQAGHQLSQAWQDFDRTAQPDEIEACIYTINAAAARYTVLLRQARKQALQASPALLCALQEQEAAQ